MKSRKYIKSLYSFIAGLLVAHMCFKRSALSLFIYSAAMAFQRETKEGSCWLNAKNAKREELACIWVGASQNMLRIWRLFMQHLMRYILMLKRSCMNKKLKKPKNENIFFLIITAIKAFLILYVICIYCIFFICKLKLIIIKCH